MGDHRLSKEAEEHIKKKNIRMACNNNPDTDFALYIQLCIKTETLSVYKYVYACSSYAAVLCKF